MVDIVISSMEEYGNLKVQVRRKIVLDQFTSLMLVKAICYVAINVDPTGDAGSVLMAIICNQIFVLGHRIL